MTKDRIAPPPPPMPSIQAASHATGDLVKSAQRANDAWTKSQMVDALRSVRYWLELAEKTIEHSGNDDPHSRPQA